jgi:membrane-bound lytic murein transglycosylase A
LPFAFCLLTFLLFPSLNTLHAASPVLERIAAHKVPKLFDDLSRTSLKAAVRQSLTALRPKRQSESLSFGTQSVSVGRIRDSLKQFYALLETEEDLNAAVLRDFDIYRVTSPVVFTAYHEPRLKGSLVRTERYRYPLYRPPDDLVELAPTSRKSKKRMGRRANGKLVPYFTRTEIDGKNIFSGKQYEIAWVDDPVALFFLHIQGSGQIELPDGLRIRIGYAGTNGLPYTSIGNLMRKQGKLRQGEASASDIRRYLYAHPKEQQDIFFQNKRYIFFQRSSGNPRGSLGAPLTAGRSIATDPRVYPPGALGFIRTRKPVLAQQEPVGWKDFSRFVLLQDSGAAITGPGRVDVFWGSGAQIEAGYMAEDGELYLLMKKR